MRIDLPWADASIVPGVGSTDPNMASPPTDVPSPTSAEKTDSYVTLSTSFLQAQIDFGLQQIIQAKFVIAHYENQVAEYRLLMDVASHSGQQVGE